MRKPNRRRGRSTQRRGTNREPYRQKDLFDDSDINRPFIVTPFRYDRQKFSEAQKQRGRTPQPTRRYINVSKTMQGRMVVNRINKCKHGKNAARHYYFKAKASGGPTQPAHRKRQPKRCR
jgi:hypothetical protein